MKISLQKAIEKMTENPGSGDICKKTNGLDCGFMVNDSCQIVTSRDGVKSYPFESCDFYGDKWEIIRAEPEVLTETQAFEKYDDYGGPLSVDFESGFRTGYGHGIPNGQIKEYKRLKPLRDATELAVKSISIYTTTKSKLESALKNLTPPWEPEK